MSPVAGSKLHLGARAGCGAEYKSVGTLCGAQAGSIELARRCHELKGHADADADSSSAAGATWMVAG